MQLWTARIIISIMGDKTNSRFIIFIIYVAVKSGDAILPETNI